MVKQSETLIAALKELSKINFAIAKTEEKCWSYEDRLTEKNLNHIWGDRFENLARGLKERNSERDAFTHKHRQAWEIQIAILKGLQIAKKQVRTQADEITAGMNADDVKFAVNKARMTGG